jgi:hypothetical protein
MCSLYVCSLIDASRNVQGREEVCSRMCQRALTRLLSHGSLAHNQLCSIDRNGNGTYTAEGITKLCEALKGSAVTSLKCAATQKCLLSCQCPLTIALLPLAVCSTVTRFRSTS